MLELEYGFNCERIQRISDIDLLRFHEFSQPVITQYFQSALNRVGRIIIITIDKQERFHLQKCREISPAISLLLKDNYFDNYPGLIIPIVLI